MTYFWMLCQIIGATVLLGAFVYNVAWITVHLLEWRDRRKARKLRALKTAMWDADFGGDSDEHRRF
jgi:hypothetical protein